MDHPELGRNYQLLAVGVGFLCVSVFMVGIGLLLVLVAGHLVTLTVAGAVMLGAGVFGPGLLGMLIVRTGARRNWPRDKVSEPRLATARSIHGPTAATQRQMALIWAAFAPPGALVVTVSDMWSRQPVDLAVRDYVGGILVGLSTAALAVLLFRDSEGRILSIRTMERVPPPATRRRTALRLAGILLPLIPLVVLFRLAPGLQPIWDGSLVGYTFVICGLIWYSYLRQHRDGTHA